MIDWSQAPEWANYAIKNNFGVCFWADKKPKIDENGIISYNNFPHENKFLITPSSVNFNIPNSTVVPRTESNNALQTQEGGNHYKNLKIQPVEYIVANQLDYLQGKVIECITDCKIKKAIHYCQLILQMQYKEGQENEQA